MGWKNVRNSKVSQEEDKLIQQKLHEAIGYTVEQLAAQLDQAAAEYAAHPELNLNPPKGEFEKILAMAAQDDKNEKEDGHKVIRLKRVMKPMILVAAVGAILLGTGMMASGRRYYKYWVREDGKGQIIFNNVDASSEMDSLEQAYKQIEDQMGIEIPQLFYIPEELDFEKVVVERGMARLDFNCKDGYLYYEQISKENANSTGYNSDREPYKTIYNRFLNADIKIYKNVIENNQTEFSAQYINGNTFYYLVGTMEEEMFDKIIKNMSYEGSVSYKK